MIGIVLFSKCSNLCFLEAFAEKVNKDIQINTPSGKRFEKIRKTFKKDYFEIL